jgi:hypothetical protein
MKTTKLKLALKTCVCLCVLLLLGNCNNDDSTQTVATPTIEVTGTIVAFPDTDVLSTSTSQGIEINASNLTGSLNISVSSNFEVSLDDANFSSQVAISSETANTSSQIIYIRFAPGLEAVGAITGTLTLQSAQATTVTRSLNGTGVSITPVITLSETTMTFESTTVGEESASQQITVNGDNLDTGIAINVTGDFLVSLDDTTFGNNLQIPANDANDSFVLYVKFAPSEVGAVTSTISLENAEADNVEVTLSGEGIPVTHNYITFNEQALGFGGGFNQSAEGVFNLHTDLSNIKEIKMYLQIDCPDTGCDDWDRFANVQVKDPVSGDWYEMGRYITPYWVGTQLLDRGLEFDVTDFKSMLSGSVELRIYIENWTAKADLVSVDFDFVEGQPDYPYYAVSEVLGYHANSISGVPYGVDHNFDLTKQISIPANSESTHLRTTISGWGHATPADAGNRTCAEWCYRTHDVMIDGVLAFQHELGPLGCAQNPINNQNPGNWQPDRAGWCPGMVVPTRIDSFGTAYAGNSFNFEYYFMNWTSDGASNAYYATSTYVVVKSNTPISQPSITD